MIRRQHTYCLAAICLAKCKAPSFALSPCCGRSQTLPVHIGGDLQWELRSLHLHLQAILPGCKHAPHFPRNPLVTWQQHKHAHKPRVCDGLNNFFFPNVNTEDWEKYYVRSSEYKIWYGVSLMVLGLLDVDFSNYLKFFFHRYKPWCYNYGVQITRYPMTQETFNSHCVLTEFLL